MQPSSQEARLPIIVLPSSLNFYLDDQSTHKQVLTLYNPYEFLLRFKVLCTAPRKYTVVDPEGSIKPGHFIDIVVRHNAVIPINCNVSDKFRIQMHEHGHKRVLGKRDIPATLLAGKPELSEKSGTDGDEFESLQESTSKGPSPPPRQQYSIGKERTEHMLHFSAPSRGIGTPNYVAVLVAIVCIVALVLPTEGEASSSVPTYLHLSQSMKLIFAYAFGLVTMVILKT